MNRIDKAPEQTRRKKWARSNRERCWKRATLRANRKEEGRAPRPTREQVDAARDRRITGQAIRARLRTAKQTGDREGETAARKELDAYYGIERPKVAPPFVDGEKPPKKKVSK